MAYLIQHNHPEVGCVSWQNLNMQYNGSSYAIADGYTDRTYVWWELGDPYVLKASNDFPELTAADALVLLNKNGTAMLVPGATILDGALIVPGTILAEALSANSVTGEKILAGEIDTAHLAAGAITADVIAAGAIGAAAIAAGAIQADHLDADVITSDKIVAEAVTAAKIAVNAVTANKIAANAVTSAKIKAGEISANHLAANAVTADKIVAGAVTAAKISVDDLSAISGKFTSLMAGTVNGARLELGEDAGTPFLEAYDSENDLRVKLLQDSLEFSAGGITGGKLEAEYFDAGGEGDQAGLLLSSTYSIKLQAFYYAWMETYGAAVQCAGESVAAWADIGIYFRAPEIKVQDGVLWLRDPGTSAGNRQLDFTGDYSLWRDATGAGGNDTRLWLDTPNFGEVVIGPRAGSSYLGRLRIRAWDILLDGDPLLRPQQSSGKGFVGNSTYPFAQMHSYSFVQASSERIKTDIFDMDCKDAYNKVKDLKVRRYKYVGKGKREHLGLISEESPYEILSEDGKGVDLYAYISMLAAAVQEMQAKIEVLEETISDLRG